MRKYNEQGDITKVVCNRCGKEMKVENGVVKEGWVPANIVFEYFSNRDGERHKFDLCESCYDEITGTFQIPIDITEDTELL